DELAGWYKMSYKPLRKFFNTSGMLYREMNLKDKLGDMTDDEMLDLLATDGMLVKRPLVIEDGGVLLGFREAEWEDMLCRR
ncbi:MAG: arsenate reductase family protein, partial [Mogibacterium sp.]|nr:arsenate reductase family protein [Mogibacterium sp.]